MALQQCPMVLRLVFQVGPDVANWSLTGWSSGFGLMQASRSAAGRVTWVLTPRTVNRVAGSLRNQRGGVFSLVVGGRVRSVEAGPQDSGEAPRTCSFGGQAPTISVGRGRPSGMRHRAGVTPLVCYHQFGTTRFNSVNSVQLRSGIGARRFGSQPSRSASAPEWARLCLQRGGYGWAPNRPWTFHCEFPLISLQDQTDVQWLCPSGRVREGNRPRRPSRRRPGSLSPVSTPQFAASPPFSEEGGGAVLLAGLLEGLRAGTGGRASVALTVFVERPSALLGLPVNQRPSPATPS